MDKPITILPLFIQQTRALANQFYKPSCLLFGFIQLHLLQGFNLLSQLLNQLILINQRATILIFSIALSMNPIRQPFHQSAQIIQAQIGQPLITT